MENSLQREQPFSVNLELEQKVARLSLLCDITRAINSIIDRDELLRLILKKTKEVLNVQGASVIFWNQKENMLYFPIVAEETEEIEKCLKGVRFSANKGIAGWVLHEGKPLLVQDVNKDERFYKEIDRHTKTETRSILCVPLHGTKGLFGVLEAVNKKNGEFTQDDQDLLVAMADNIAISIEKANLYHDLQKAEAFLRRQNAELKRSIKQKYSFENIIGKSDKIIDIIKKAEQVSLTDLTVFIYGETGTGKELLAQAIHNNSPRCLNNFVAINCGAIPENLLESELFGHERGAFTTAHERRIGRFEDANNGTFFLDEIGDMPLSLQTKLLRTLQEGVIQHLGSNRDIPVDVRLIAATHQDLQRSVQEGRFRQDLYYRLKVFELEIPPLRERRDDIPILIDHFIKLSQKKLGKHILGIDNNALEILINYNYPGNVRELQHIIERGMILCKRNIIGIDNLPSEIRNIRPSVKALVDCEEFLTIPKNNDELKAMKAKVRKMAEEKIDLLFLKDILARSQGNISEAARQAKMNRSWLAQLVIKNKIDLKEFRKNNY